MEYEELNYFIKRVRDGCKGNQLKDELQTFGTNKWLRSGGIGAIEAFTGYGKSHQCKKVFTRYRAKNNDNIIVIVPSYNLQEDFLSIGRELGLTNYYVYVIKGYTMTDNLDTIRNCGLLVVDELHRCCGEMSEYFKNVIPLTTFKYFLGLSATLSYEHKLFLEQYNIKTIFSINITEGIRLGIVPEYNIYNVGVSLTTEERIAYMKNDDYFKSYFKYFNIGTGHNAFDLMMACAARGEEIKKVASTEEGLVSNTSNQWAAFVSGFFDDLTYKDIKTKAVMAIKSMTERESIVNKAQNKTLFLIRALNSINEVNAKRLELEENPLFTMSFIHDKEQVEDIQKGTRTGLHTYTSFGYYSSLAKKVKDSILSNFKLGVFYHLLTFKALDEGYDNKKLSIGFNLYYHSKVLNTIQRLGRIIRKDENNPDKEGIFIFVYCLPFMGLDKNQEAIEVRPADCKRLPKIQKDMTDVTYLTEEQCLEMLKKL